MTVREFCSKYHFEDSEIVSVERHIPFYNENGEFLVGIKNKDITRSKLADNNGNPSPWHIMTFKTEIHALPNKDKWTEQTIDELIDIIFSDNRGSNSEQPQKELTHTTNLDEYTAYESIAQSIELYKESIKDSAPTLVGSVVSKDVPNDMDTIIINNDRELPKVDYSDIDKEKDDQYYGF